MKPLQHARMSAHRYEEDWQPYVALHAWFDQTKAHYPSMQHRAFLHSPWGMKLAQEIFSDLPGIEDAVIAHQLEDIGRVPTMQDWTEHFDTHELETRSHKRLYSEPAMRFRSHHPNFDTYIEEKFHLEHDEMRQFLGFFNGPEARAIAETQNTDTRWKSFWFSHNSLGIFLLAQKHGEVYRTKSGRLISTRDIGEQIVQKRVGFIPSAAMVASHIRLQPWMAGSDVIEALKARKEKGSTIDLARRCLEVDDE